MAKQHESVRELELSRALARLFGVLPYEIVSAFVLAIYHHGSNDLEDRHELNHQIDTEQKLENDDRKRLDVVIPLAIGTYTEIIFETKLGKEDLHQVEGYAGARKNSLVISLAKILYGETKIKNIRRLEWRDFFWGLFPLLGIDAQRRLYPYDEGKSENFKPDFPKFPLGFIAEMKLEDFLRDLSFKRCVELTTGRVLVVTGEFAAATCKYYHIDFYGQSWDQLFDYVCVVHHKKLQYVGKVKTKYNNIRFEENGIIDQNDLKLPIDPKAVREIYNLDKDLKLGGSSIALLEDIDTGQNDLWKGIKLGDEYARKGAVTQSHRYFDSPQKFIEYFKYSGKE